MRRNNDGCVWISTIMVILIAIMIKYSLVLYGVILITIFVVITVIIPKISQKRKEKKREKQYEEQQIEKKRQDISEEQFEEKRIAKEQIEELRYENVTVVFAYIKKNGKPGAIVKRSNDTYGSVEKSDNFSPFQIGETLILLKEKTNTWNWVNEQRYEQAKKYLQAEIEKEEQKKILEQQNDPLQKQFEILNKYGIDYLYHMTHKDNLDNILQNGLKSHNYARSKGLLQNDIADNIVNDRRGRKKPIYQRSLHDYVPLYFNPKNPMLYVRQDIQNDIIIFAIDRAIFFQKNTLFTDGNAAADTTQFYNNIQDLNKLNWQCIYNQWWNDFSDGKRLRCSEVLVYPDIPIQKILKIYCRNEQTKEFIEKKIVNIQSIDTEINTNLYFVDSAYIAELLNNI